VDFVQSVHYSHILSTDSSDDRYRYDNTSFDVVLTFRAADTLS